MKGIQEKRKKNKVKVEYGVFGFFKKSILCKPHCKPDACNLVMYTCLICIALLAVTLHQTYNYNYLYRKYICLKFTDLYLFSLLTISVQQPIQQWLGIDHNSAIILLQHDVDICY